MKTILFNLLLFTVKLANNNATREALPEKWKLFLLEVGKQVKSVCVGNLGGDCRQRKEPGHKHRQDPSHPMRAAESGGGVNWPQLQINPRDYMEAKMNEQKEQKKLEKKQLLM